MDNNESVADKTFTTESSSRKESNSEESDGEETMIVILTSSQQPFCNENLSAQSAEALNFLVAWKLYHLTSCSQADNQEELFRADQLASSRDDLGGSKTPASHCIEPTDTRPIFDKL